MRLINPTFGIQDPDKLVTNTLGTVDWFKDPIVLFSNNKPNIKELSEAFGNIAAECQTGEGHLGEIPESLKSMTDSVWLKNMNAFVDEQIKRSVASSRQAEDDIPF